MNHCAFAACEEMRNSVDRRGGGASLFCPKPRRVGQLAAGIIDPVALRWHDAPDSSAGADLMDILLTKGGEAASSPPFFCGSPPVRADNPVVHDARFGEDKASPGSSPPRMGFARAKFGLAPAAVRIEGFECRLDRDRRSITAVA